MIDGVRPARAFSDVPVSLLIDAPTLRPALVIDVASGALTVDESSIQLSLVPEDGAGLAPVGLGPARWDGVETFVASVPADVPAGSYALRVVAPSGKSTRLADAFQELGPDVTPPTITLESPAAGGTLAAGAMIGVMFLVDDGEGELASVTWRTADGTNGACALGADPDTGDPPSSVNCTVTFLAPALIGTAPTTMPFSFQVTATDAAGNATILATALTVAKLPIVTGFSNSVGGLAGGQPFVVHGFYFLPGSRAFIGKVPILGSVPGGEVQDDMTIVGLTPPDARAESLAVQVVSPAGAATANATFAYVAPPLPRNITPASGPASGGILVTVDGNDLRTGASVSLGPSLDVALPLVNPTYTAGDKVVGCLPAGTGTVSVWVQDAITGNGVLAGAFTYDDDDAAPAPGAPGPATDPVCLVTAQVYAP